MFRRRLRRYGPVIITLATLLLLGVSTAVAMAVQDAMRSLADESMRSHLSANVRTLEMWIVARQADAERIAAVDGIDHAARALLNRHAVRPEQVSAAPQPSGSEALVSRHVAADSYLGWALLDDQRNVVASSVEELVGTELAVPDDAWRRMARRNATVTRPFTASVTLTDQGPLSQPGGPLMCGMAPITDGARPIGSLALLIDPQAEFTELLSAAPLGQSGQCYAFDRTGTLITRSRFEHQLRVCGLLNPDPLITSTLQIVARDPGANLTTGGTASQAPDRQPLTLMADSATRGGSDSNADGYNDYRGVPVIGAWCWLPDYEIGVATEMSVAEAYRPLRILQQFALALGSVIVCSALGRLVLPSLFQRLRARMDDAAGAARRLGQYDLGEMVGRGGMGAVYRGRHRLLGRDVAIKVLEGDQLDPQSISRFEREAKMTARLRHPNTIDIHDFGKTDDGAFFYVMEFVDGITLQELVDRFGPQPPPRVIHLLLQICGSLSEAHQLGMIHRDIKPGNLLLTARAGLYDMIKVLDFGLVKEVNRETVELTHSDGITGTPMYMSPEAVRDAATATQQSDLYSVGAVGYTLLTGLPTFEGDSSVDVCLKQLNEAPIRPCDRVGQPLPDDLQNVLMSCLRKERQERPLSIDDLESALRQCMDAGRWSAADALRWWEVEFPAATEPEVRDDDDGKPGAAEQSPRKTAT